MLLSALIDRFVPEGFGDSPDLRRRARVLIGGALAFFMASASLATLGMVVEGSVNPRVAALLILAAAAGAAPFALRRTGKLAPSIHLIAMGAVTVMAVNSYTLGGVRGSTLSLALVLCVSIHFLAGAWVASFWTAVCALVIAGLVGLSMTGHTFPMALDDQSGPLMAGVAILVQLGVVHAVSWLYDTERNRATQALDLALAEAEHANGELREGLAALETFARTASHDLRGPAARTQMMIDFLLEEHGESVDDDVRDWLGRIRGESERMRELIDDVLEFERSKLAQVVREPVDFADLTRELIAELAHEQPDRNVDVQVPERLVLSADPNMARVALANLLGNAWKYSGQQAQARIVVGAAAPDGLFVQDNGAGFDPEQAAGLFEPFVRLHSAKDFAGNGVGLATVHRIAVRHGGFVRAESQPGAGATFTVSFGAG